MHPRLWMMSPRMSRQPSARLDEVDLFRMALIRVVLHRQRRAATSRGRRGGGHAAPQEERRSFSSLESGLADKQYRQRQVGESALSQLLLERGGQVVLVHVVVRVLRHGASEAQGLTATDGPGVLYLALHKAGTAKQQSGRTWLPGHGTASR
jgi:hypothetical protein